MKRFLLLTFALFSLCFVKAQNKYSVELFSDFGVNQLTANKNFKELLSNGNFPEFESLLVVTGGGGFTFRINRWGIMFKNQISPIRTRVKNNYYYSGELDSFDFGVSYDVIKKEKFSLSPYILIGNSESIMYLDYELKEGVIPSSLRLDAKHSDFNIGLKSHFRVGVWFENRLELFVTADAYYRYMTFFELRANNMLLGSKDSDFNQLGLSSGLSLRYNF